MPRRPGATPAAAERSGTALDGPRRPHWTGLESRRGTALPTPPALTLDLLPPRRSTLGPAALPRQSAPAPAAPATTASSSVPAVRNTAAAAPARTEPAFAAAAATGAQPLLAPARQAADLLAELGLRPSELLVAVLNGQVSVTTVLGAVRLHAQPDPDRTATSTVVVVASPAAQPLAAEDVLVRTGLTLDELLAAVLSGAVAVHRTLGALRFEASELGLAAATPPYVTAPSGAATEQS